jgi:lipoate-protein ligase A
MARAPLALARQGSKAAVVLGRSQYAMPTDPVLPVRRRASGGGAVLTGPWLLRSAVLLPRGHAVVTAGMVAAARWFGTLHLDWLRSHGIEGAQLHEGPTLAHWACFAGRGPGEVLVGGRKIVGIAQVWRRRAVLLSAGTLLAPQPWPLLCATLRQPAEQAVGIAAATVSAFECLGREVDGAAWAETLRASLAQAVAMRAPGPMAN